MWSPNGKYELVMQANGNLVEYGPSGAAWATGTPASGGVIYGAPGGGMWTSSSAVGGQHRPPAPADAVQFQQASWETAGLNFIGAVRF